MTLLFSSPVHVTDNNLLALVVFDGGVNGPMFVTCHVLVKEIGWAVPWATHFAVANSGEEGGGGRDGKLGDDFEKRKMEKLFPFTTGNAARFSSFASSECNHFSSE